MGTDGIYLLRDGEAGLVPMRSSGFLTEDDLQALIARHPDLLAGGQMNAAQPRRWLLLSREMGVPRREGGGDHWSVDHLLVDQDAVPTIVEVKRSTDTRIRREVVGQMLDYAANGARYWTTADLRRRLEVTLGSDADQAQTLLEDVTGDPDVDVDTFLRRVEDNLRGGRLRLVFVADVIPAELRSVVEFLNAQMSPADVFAVEVRQYVGDGVRTLVPRVVGATAAAAIRKQSGPQLSYDELLATAGTTARELDCRIVTLAEQLGLTVRNTRKARQVVHGEGTVFQYYPTWGTDGALEVNLTHLRHAGRNDAATTTREELSSIAGRTVSAKAPWLTVGEVLPYWDRFGALVRDTVLPALS